MSEEYFRKLQRRVTGWPRWARLAAGVLLVLGGLAGVLPVLGFWMLPLGLLILSYDIPVVRRLRRQAEVRLLRRWKRWRNRSG